MADILFHGGVLLAALAGCHSFGAVWLSLLAPSSVIAIVFAATKSLEDRQRLGYKTHPEFQGYLDTTPRLFPGARPT